jgi:NTE family protein
MEFWRKSKKIGLALGGGGARGFAHIGVLEVLESEGINISAIAGTSMGSVIGSLYASGVTIKDILDFMNSNDWKRFLISANFTIPNLPAINSRRVNKILSKLLGDKTFDDCRLPFCAVAADIVSKEKVFLKEGKLIEAIKASIAIPGVFEPVVRDGQILIDGGVVEPVPIEAVRSMDVDFVIAVALDNVERKAIPNSKTSVLQMLDVSLAMMEREIYEKYFPGADVIIQPRTGNFGVFEFGKAQELINTGKEATLNKVWEIKRKIS